MRDHIDISHPLSGHATGDSVAVLIRLRSSLLSTVIFYDLMLGTQGARAVDWLARDLAEIGTAMEVADFVYTNLGLSLQIRGASGFREFTKIADPGPIAWKDVAVIVPVEQADSLRFRLDFVADNWRIERVAVARSWRAVPPRRIAPTRFTVSDGRTTEAPRPLLASVDSTYMVTQPSDRFFIHFDTERRGESSNYAYLVAAHGYYTEWIRGEWVTRNPTPRKFVPGQDALFTALKQWRERKHEMEAKFHAVRVPVR
jgi:hypothetical protein